MHELLADWEASADRYQRRRWLFSALIVSSCGAAVVAGVQWIPAAAPAAPPTAAMVVELAPIPTTVPESSAQPVGKPQVEAPPPTPAQPEPDSQPELKPAFDAESIPEIRTPVPANVTLPKPAEEPAQKPEKQQKKETVTKAPAPKTTAPPRQQAPLADTAASPRRSAPAAASPATRILFQQHLLEHLERHKRYPRMAQRKRMEGVSYVRFAMDRQGKVLSARLERSSGHRLLDDEALTLLQRSQPLPPIPAEMAKETLKIVVPVRFFLDR